MCVIIDNHIMTYYDSLFQQLSIKLQQRSAEGVELCLNCRQV